MWTTTETLPRIQPAYQETVTGNIDYTTADTYISTEVNFDDATTLYLYKIDFVPKYEANFFANINANIRVVLIDNDDSDTYQDSSIETLSNAKEYLTALNFYQRNTLDTIYLFTPHLEDVFINVEYELTNISAITDLYPFLANEANIVGIQLKASSDSNYQAITKEFLLGFQVTYATGVKITLRYKLIDSNHIVTSVFNNKLNVQRKTVNVYSHTLENWQDIDIVSDELKHEYYRNELFSNLANRGFIMNDSYIYQIL